MSWKMSACLLLVALYFLIFTVQKDEKKERKRTKGNATDFWAVLKVEDIWEKIFPKGKICMSTTKLKIVLFVLSVIHGLISPIFNFSPIFFNFSPTISYFSPIFFNFSPLKNERWPLASGLCRTPPQTWVQNKCWSRNLSCATLPIQV